MAIARQLRRAYYFVVSDFKDASCLGRARVSAQAYAHDERNKLLAWADVMTAAGDFSRETGLRREVKLGFGLVRVIAAPGWQHRREDARCVVSH